MKLPIIKAFPLAIIPILIFSCEVLEEKRGLYGHYEISSLIISGQVLDMAVAEGYLTINGDASNLLSIAYKKQPEGEVQSFAELVSVERNGSKVLKLYVGNLPEFSEPYLDRNYLGRFYNKEGRIMLEVKGYNGRIYPSSLNAGVAIQLEAIKISD